MLEDELIKKTPNGDIKKRLVAENLERQRAGYSARLAEPVEGRPPLGYSRSHERDKCAEITE